ncbi:MAG: hypothetical protein PVI01_08390 [Gemmatimonadales bacterium]|jgi:hypothetical protein
MTALSFAILALSAQLPIAAGGAMEASARLERDSVEVGVPVVLTVTLSPVPPAAVVLFPELPDSGRLVALAPPRTVPVETEARSARYELVAWETGDLKIPGAGIRIVVDEAELTIPFPEVTLHVASVLPGDADVEAIAWRPPADVVGANWSTVEIAAAATLLLALLIGAFLYLRRRGRGTAVPLPTPMAPRERALVGLDLLSRYGLIEAGELKGFYSALSLIMRRFLAETEERWGLDLTTRQLVWRVGEDGVTESDVRALEALLSQADLVKFAGLRPAANEASAALKLARGWLEDFERIERPPDLSPAEVADTLGDSAEDVLAEFDEVFLAKAGEPVSAPDEEDVAT